VPQQEFAQPVACAELVLLRCLARTDQIARGFVRRGGHAHRRQVTGAITPRENRAEVLTMTDAAQDREIIEANNSPTSIEAQLGW
jgi:hypothetical protein